MIDPSNPKTHTRDYLGLLARVRAGKVSTELLVATLTDLADTCNLVLEYDDAHRVAWFMNSTVRALRLVNGNDDGLFGWGSELAGRGFRAGVRLP